MKPEFAQQIFEKYSNIKLHGNPSSGSRVVPYGQTDEWMGRHDEASGRLSQFCERAKETQSAQTDSEAHPVSYPTGNVVLCRG